MKNLFILFLVSTLIVSSGCMSSGVADLAEGYTNERIDASDLQKGDRVIDEDRVSAYVIRHSPRKDTTHLEVPTPPSHLKLYIARPHPAYYALAPLAVAADIATLPIQVLVIGISVAAGGW